MGLHTGEALVVEGRHYGLEVHRRGADLPGRARGADPALGRNRPGRRRHAASGRGAAGHRGAPAEGPCSNELNQARIVCRSFSRWVPMSLSAISAGSVPAMAGGRVRQQDLPAVPSLARSGPRGGPRGRSDYLPRPASRRCAGQSALLSPRRPARRARRGPAASQPPRQRGGGIGEDYEEGIALGILLRAHVTEACLR